MDKSDLPVSLGGESPVGTPPTCADELHAMLMCQVHENRRLLTIVNACRARIAELERLVDADTLTPLPNRRHFVRELARAIEQRRRYGARAWVMFVDLDGMKAINDTYGHVAGDAALIHVARLLREKVRAADVVARLGGDEFGLLLEKIDEDGVRDKAAALVRAVRRSPAEVEGFSIQLSITIGHAELKADDDAERIIARADRAMYRERAQLRSAR